MQSLPVVVPRPTHHCLPLLSPLRPFVPSLSSKDPGASILGCYTSPNGIILTIFINTTNVDTAQMTTAKAKL